MNRCRELAATSPIHSQTCFEFCAECIFGDGTTGDVQFFLIGRLTTKMAGIQVLPVAPANLALDFLASSTADLTSCCLPFVGRPISTLTLKLVISFDADVATLLYLILIHLIAHSMQHRIGPASAVPYFIQWL